LFRAYCLAFSRVRSLPNNNSASNSEVIESSNCKSELLIAATFSTVVPNAFACTTAFANAPGWACRESRVALETSLTLSKISFSFRARSLCRARALASPRNSEVIPSTSFPVNILISYKVPRASPDNCTVSFNS